MPGTAQVGPTPTRRAPNRGCLPVELVPAGQLRLNRIDAQGLVAFPSLQHVHVEMWDLLPTESGAIVGRRRRCSLCRFCVSPTGACGAPSEGG
jgi:hypothetical protein